MRNCGQKAKRFGNSLSPFQHFSGLKCNSSQSYQQMIHPHPATIIGTTSVMVFQMGLAENYVLVLGQESEDLQALRAVLATLCCSVAIASSEDQAMSHISCVSPCLVILAGNHQPWTQTLVDKLRYNPSANWVTIVALTDVYAPSWLHQDENSGFDGFLVKPVTDDILTSLVQSARARQTCGVLQSALPCS